MSERLEERLRMAAQTYRNLGNHTAEVMFLEAADTIWQLRDDLQRTNEVMNEVEHDESCAWDRVRKAEAEADKLREELEFERSENGWAREFLNRMGQKCGTKDCPSLVAYVTKLEAENAKLQELCRGALVVLENNCSQCVYFYECDIGNDCKCVAPMHIREELRELENQTMEKTN